MPPPSDPDFFSLQVTEARRFFLGIPTGDVDSSLVVCGGIEWCNRNYRVARETFPFYSIEFVIRGTGRFIAAGRAYELSAGTAFSYGPDVSHEIVSSERDPLVKYFFDLKGVETLRALSSAGLGPGTALQTAAPEELRRICEDLIDAGVRQSALQRSVCACLIQLLLLRIRETAIPLGSLGSISFETYEECRRYIESHYREITSLSDLAARFHLDPSYVCRTFKKYDRQSPWQLILQLRMRDAAERLRVPGTLVKTAAAELGFRDVFEFSRTFRRILGISPNHFSKLQRPMPLNEVYGSKNGSRGRRVK